MTIEELVGERLMIGLSGATLTDADVSVFRDTRAAGLILYRRNYEGPAALATLLDSLEAALDRGLLVATDHEGGRIVMLGAAPRSSRQPRDGHRGRGSVRVPPGRDRGARAAAARHRSQPRPCLDVLTERYSPNIGIRSYGKDPRVVSRYGVARIRGMARGGLSACPKHFPGKGHSPLDAHLKLPTIDSTPEEMRPSTYRRH